MATIRTGPDAAPGEAVAQASTAQCWGVQVQRDSAVCLVPKRDGKCAFKDYVDEGGLFGYPKGYKSLPAGGVGKIIGPRGDSTNSGVRTRLVIQNNGFVLKNSVPYTFPFSSKDIATPASIFIGPDSSVTSSSGYEIKPGESLELTTTDAVFAVAESVSNPLTSVSSVGVCVWEEISISNEMKIDQTSYITSNGTVPTDADVSPDPALYPTFTGAYSNPKTPPVENPSSPVILTGQYSIPIGGLGPAPTYLPIKVSNRDSFANSPSVGVGVVGSFRKVTVRNTHSKESIGIWPRQPSWFLSNLGGVPPTVFNYTCTGIKLTGAASTTDSVFSGGYDQQADGTPIYSQPTSNPSTSYFPEIWTTGSGMGFRLLPGQTFTTEVNNEIWFKGWNNQDFSPTMELIVEGDWS